MSGERPHHVLIERDRNRFHSKFREIEAWLAEWQIGAEIGSVPGSSGLLRVRFADERAAYAFLRCHGGRAIPAEEIEAAKLADATDKDVYERLAREYPD